MMLVKVCMETKNIGNKRSDTLWIQRHECFCVVRVYAKNGHVVKGEIYTRPSLVEFQIVRGIRASFTFPA